MWLLDFSYNTCYVLLKFTDVEVHTGQEAVFTCTVDDHEAPFEWFLNGQKITENDKFSFKGESANPKIKKLTIKDCQLIDDGSVGKSIF